MSGLRHDKEVLDPHATDPYTIEPRLYGHHLTGLQLLSTTRSQPWRFVNQQTHTDRKSTRLNSSHT